MKNTHFVSLLVIVFGLFSLVSIARAEGSASQDKKILVQNLVNEAVELIKTQGPAGVKIISDKNGKFNTKDAYVFVTSGSGADLINPAFKEIEGMPLETYSEPTSREAQKIIVNAVKEQDSAWVEYLWPKPGEIKPSRKISYLKKIIVNGKVRIVGAGFYPQE